MRGGDEGNPDHFDSLFWLPMNYDTENLGSYGEGLNITSNNLTLGNDAELLKVASSYVRDPGILTRLFDDNSVANGQWMPEGIDYLFDGYKLNRRQCVRCCEGAKTIGTRSPYTHAEKKKIFGPNGILRKNCAIVYNHQKPRFGRTLSRH